MRKPASLQTTGARLRTKRKKALPRHSQSRTCSARIPNHFSRKGLQKSGTLVCWSVERTCLAWEEMDSIKMSKPTMNPTRSSMNMNVCPDTFSMTNCTAVRRSCGENSRDIAMMPPKAVSIPTCKVRLPPTAVLLNCSLMILILTFGLFLSYPHIRIIFQSPPRWKHAIRIFNSALSQAF